MVVEMVDMKKGFKHSEETKLKMSESHKGKGLGKDNSMYNRKGENNPNFGKSRSEETKRKISLGSKGKKKPESLSGKNHWNWKGGVSYNKDGYRIIWTEDKDSVLEHRYIMEKYLNRALTSNEIVHHKDENRLNNDINNLQLMTNSEHNKIHHKK